MRLKALAGVLLLSWTAAAFAQTAAPAAPSPFKFEFHGFASGTFWMQDGRGNGQGGLAEFAAAPQPLADKLSLGTDVRQSRFNWSVAGPAVFGGAIPRAVMEIDWYGNYGAGGSGDIHLLPRLRIAYAELTWGGGAHRLQFGQQNDLMGAISPVSLAKIGQSLHLAAGNLGFRHPGIFGYHTFGDLKDRNASRVEFAWQVTKTRWIETANGATTNGIGGSACQSVVGGSATTATQTLGAQAGVGAGICAGEASALPMVAARLSFMAGQNFTAFVSGTWERIDRSGVGQTDLTGNLYPFTTIESVAGIAGAKAVAGPLTLSGAAFYGKNVAHMTADFTTSQYSVAGDVREFGAWGQLGFNLTKEFSAWWFSGIEIDNNDDIRVTNTLFPGSMPVFKNLTHSAMLQYRDGGFAVGLEWVHYRTYYFVPNGGATTTALAAAGFNTNIMSMNSFLLTGIYFF